MPISIEGKRILVTGGARGIGGESSRYFAREGAHVVTFDVKDDEGQQLADEATSEGPGTVSYRHVDVSNLNEIATGVDFAIEQLGGLDAVFNVAGITRSAPAEATPVEDWNDQFAINVRGLAYVCEATFPHLKDNGGSIVNFASDAALMDVPIHSSSFSASKGAVISYTRTIGREWAPYAIRANVVNPVVMTPIVEEVRSKMAPEERERYEREIDASVPLGGRLGDITLDLAPVLMFLASDASRFITSQILGVNGGLAYSR
ncbi:SDR family NAD(P)-dependent oxidoreductase [Arthrobacter sp. ISL-28]|uniref:SDR family NAD(P)-dependent oxidoreductase n=1 Tax=Arthrobacter sp. ISL-28 TaxID=2819108 RepID=UPI001BE6AF94|nr:SDR family NAD(P)-dependent oxidoreductase [Arthrobacter sp. ISL-28]MBT2523363.1 SDR family oxidoreductase [Arthrobacter sp. ISL-28]